MNERDRYYKETKGYKSYSDNELLYKGKQIVAERRARQALANGTIEKKHQCEVCGRVGKTVMHHYKGYDCPFDVWWVCYSCNRNIPHTNDYGRPFNLRDLSSARQYIIKKVFKNPAYYWEWRKKQTEPCFGCGLEDKVGNMEVVDIGYRLDAVFCQCCAGKILD